MPKPPSDVPNSQVTPLPALEKRTRRRFSTAEKLRILDEADGCARGELGALLRREKLYSSQLQQWRRERAEQGVPGKTEPGPAASTPPHQRHIEQLEQENVRLVRQLTITQACIDLQPKSRKRMPRKTRKAILLSQLNAEGISLRSHPFNEQT
jgi:transposase